MVIKKKDPDFAVTAFRVVQEATEKREPEKSTKKNNFDAKALRRKGGLKGGKARAKKLTPARRKEIAQSSTQKHFGTIIPVFFGLDIAKRTGIIAHPFT